MKIYLDAYLAQNLGDDLFVDILTKRYPHHQFRAISKVKNNYSPANLKVFCNSYFYRGVKKYELEKYLANRCNLVVTLGGSMYMENNDSTRDFTLGKNKRYILGVNFGPYYTQEYYNNIYSIFKNAEDVCFREQYSYNLFKDLPNVRCAPDIVFSMETTGVKKTNRKRAIISVISCIRKLDGSYTEKYEQKIIELMNFLVEKGYEICLMSFCKEEKDEDAIESIIEKCDNTLKNQVETYYYSGNIIEALDVIGDSEVIFGSRFHANIIGLVLNKTIIPIIYSDKTIHVLEDLNIKPKCIDIRKLDEFDVNSLTDEDLTKKYNIDGQREQAEKHFKKLDIELGRETNE